MAISKWRFFCAAASASAFAASSSAADEVAASGTLVGCLRMDLPGVFLVAMLESRMEVC